MYTFNANKAFFIWFSKDKETFLNIENQIRLINIRKENPALQITMIYSKVLLSDTAQANMSVFLFEYNIQAKDLEALCTEDADRYSPNEQLLITFAKTELQKWTTNEGGNSASASDILRTLSPILLDYGFYFQLSSSLKLEDKEKLIPINTPMVCWVDKDERGNTVVNNNFLALATIEETGELHPHAQFIIEKIQATLLSQYTKPLSIELFQTEQSVETLIFNGILDSFIQKNKMATIFDFRKILTSFNQKSFFDLACFLKLEAQFISILNDQWNEKLKECETAPKALSDFFKDGLETFNNLNSFSPSLIIQLHGLFLLSHNKKSARLKEVIHTNQNIAEFLKTISNEEIEKFQFDFYRRTVEHISGPNVFSNTLMQHKKWNAPFISGIACMADFGLSKNKLKNHILITCNTTGKEGELSWTPKGRHKAKIRELRMKEAVRTITKAYLHYREQQPLAYKFNAKVPNLDHVITEAAANLQHTDIDAVIQKERETIQKTEQEAQTERERQAAENVFSVALPADRPKREAVVFSCATRSATKRARNEAINETEQAATAPSVGRYLKRSTRSFIGPVTRQFSDH